ncbi:MAG: YbaN family protein [Clostridium sp.]|nr:YbaN family protein [Clostridium sp.]
MKIKKILFVVLGCICLALGCIGIALPILPTVPFFLVTVFCFANSSQKLHDWFVNTKMYKKHLESFVKKKGMTVQTKATIIGSVTLLMGFGFFMMFRKAIYIPCIILGVVWVCHIIYFVFGVKTISKEEAEKESAKN